MLQKIKKHFNTELVKIYDNTAQHKNQNNKKHLVILIISNKFNEISILIRHQQVYNLLSEEIKSKIHALSIHTYTIDEWKQHKKNNLGKINCQFQK